MNSNQRVGAIRETWDAVRPSTGVEAGQYGPLHSFGWGTIYAGIDRETGTESLVVGINCTYRPLLNAPDSSGLILYTSFNERAGEWWLGVSRSPDADQAIFEAFCEDIWRHLVTLSPKADQVRVTAALDNRLALWMDFFNTSHGRKPLSEEEEKGLIGELLCFNALVKKCGIPADQVIQAWQRTFRAVRDFQFKDFDIEVKASAARRPNQYRIQSLEQLDPHTKPLLVFYAVDLMPEDDGQTLRDIIINTQASISERHAALFNDKLLLLRVHPSALLESGRKWKVAQEIHYKVDENFPFLSASSVDSRVVDASYTISLAETPPSLVGLSELIRQVVP